MKFSSWIRPLVLAFVLTTGLTVAATALAHPHGREHRHHHRQAAHHAHIGLSNHISLGHGPRRESPLAPAPVPSGEGGTTFFEGSKISDYAMLQEAPGAITEVPDPAGSGESVMKMTVSNNDVAPITPTDNPRAQALSPNIIENGQEFWLQTKFFLPPELPSIPGWMGLVAIYGAPFAGSGPWGVEIVENELRWQRNGNYQWDIPWNAPLEKGKWTTVLLHEKFASNGWVEMWINGEQITFFKTHRFNPLHEPETTRLQMQTMDSSNNGAPNAAKIMQYREAGMFSMASVYFGSLNLGTTRASVE
ncbi:MAG: heparin lyase I family protein [Actinobacteria bacterium]|nr:heparin lyase I family protein [Actinomycetota bacterium]